MSERQRGVPRTGVALAAALLAGLVPFCAGMRSAGALTQDRIVSDQNHRHVVKSYGPIAGDFPTEGVVVPTPSGCGNGPPDGDPDTSASDGTPAFEASCDRIPLKVLVPTGLDPTDDYIVQIQLSWDDTVGSVADARGTGNDMDLYLYDATQKQHQKDPTNPSPGYTQLTSSATSADPESVKLGHADLVNYNIVVVNSSGVNTGYTLTVNFTVAKGDKIFELLEQPANRAKSSDSGSPPVDLSAGPAFAPLVAPGLPDLGVTTPDLQLDETNFGPSILNHELAAPPLALAETRPKRVPPASALSLLLWLVVVPFALVGASVAFLYKRGTLGSCLTS